jgi:iron(III) transport system substrate-binding protein
MSEVRSRRRFHWTLLCGLLVAVLAGTLAIPARSQTQSVVVYTALETDEVAKYLEQARRDLPGMDIRVLRLSTGELAARVLAEKGNPQADVIWGQAATSLIPLAKQGIIEPYVPKGAYKIPNRFRDLTGMWTGVDLYVGAIGANPAELRKRGVEAPRSWADLIRPQYKGMIIMPNPTTSGTGFLHVVAILTMFGRDKGWDYLRELDKNIAQYTRSGGAPGRMVAAGEIPIALSFDFAILSFKRQGFPVELIWPTEGTGYELEANALIKGAKHPDAAKRFLDWAISLPAMQEYAQWKMGVTMPGVSAGPDVPALHTVPMLKIDLGWAGENRQSILEQWQRLLGR